jgi:hypothetical protein
MSSYKTLYVEGDLDFNILEAFLINNNINNVRIYRIMGDKHKINFGTFIQDEMLGAKKLIIELIKHSNNDNTIEQNKYLGIVDLDFDFCLSQVEEVGNLIYTDKNSMESYLIDKELFRVLADENKCETFDEFEIKFESFITNFKEFNNMFLMQIKYYKELGENLISFDAIPLNCEPFIKNDYSICTDSLMLKCNGDKEIWKNIYGNKVDELNSIYEACSSELLIFLHGKHTLRYIIGLFKRIVNIYKQIDDASIVNMLKDKFIILRKFENYTLFDRIKKMSEINI